MRKGSIASERGGCRLQRGAYKGKGLGVLTSGGDSQGMNAAVRACVRTALFLGCRVFLIHEGYQGMVDGGDNIASAEWVSVSSIIHLGGTVIGSARCEDFRHRSGRLKAAGNLVTHGITNLIVIGGDGSLTAAHIFREEWTGLLDELLKEDKITAEMKRNNHVLHVVGIVGSIDNDFCGTDMTIGTDSALHRILEGVDSIVSTATSHQRTFVLEVMGRHCGYLSIITGIVSQADFVFCPESPPPPDWPEQITNKLSQERAAGQRLNIIIVAEGAVDANGDPITAEQVKKVLTETAHRDTRVVVLGHVQRGGLPSAYDRILGCRKGAAAAMALMEATHSDDTEPVVIAIHGNQIVRISLMECVKQTKAVADAMAQKNWELAAQLRGPNFVNNINLIKESYRLKPNTEDFCKCQGDPCHRFGVMNIGVPAGGMNAAVVAFVRACIMQGDTAIGIADGLEGLIKGDCKELSLSDVVGRVSQAGSFLGIKRSLPKGRFREIAHNLRKFNIQGLLFVGGFDAYLTCLEISRQRLNFPEFCIPLVVIPATISNNVPGTEFSLGCDTSLNEITEICDRIRSSAQGTKHRVFIIETMGGRCGYLATLAAIAGGADAAYIFEEKFTIKDLSQDISHMSSKMNEGVQRGLILCNEKASKNYTTDFVHKLYAEEGKNTFSCRMNILGHLQQGGSPTPFDRKLGLKMGSKCAVWMTEQTRKNTDKDGAIKCTTDESVMVVGLVGRKFQFTKVEELVPHTDFENRIPKKQWWLRLRPLLKIMAKHASAYEDADFKPPPGPVDINCSVN